MERKRMEWILVAIGCTVLPITAARDIGEQCKVDGRTAVRCRCIGNEEFFLPEGYNYENVTSLRIASCASVNLHFSSLTEANRIAEIVVQNVSELLIFELFLTTKTMKRIKLSKIARIPLISHDTFVSLNSIETLRIEDTRIDKFEERFSDISISDFSMINVTIERVDEFSFTGKGELLRIKNSAFRSVTGTLNFAYFSTIEMVRSAFRLQKPGSVLIEGDTVYMEACVFSNSSANVVAANGIQINGTCADGKSSIRLSSDYIRSANNRVPTEIIYTTDKHRSERFFSLNNTVCRAGNCKCPKSSGQSPRFAGSFFAFAFPFLSSVAILAASP